MRSRSESLVSFRIRMRMLCDAKGTPRRSGSASGSVVVAVVSGQVSEVQVIHQLTQAEGNCQAGRVGGNLPRGRGGY